LRKKGKEEENNDDGVAVSSAISLQAKIKREKSQKGRKRGRSPILRSIAPSFRRRWEVGKKIGKKKKGEERGQNRCCICSAPFPYKRKGRKGRKKREKLDDRPPDLPFFFLLGAERESSRGRGGGGKEMLAFYSYYSSHQAGKSGRGRKSPKKKKRKRKKRNDRRLQIN